MKFGLLVSLVVLVLPSVECLHKLLNIDYLGIGYDAIQGNPQNDLEDPGFKQSIFPLEYGKEVVTADGRFLIPDNTEAYQMMNCGYQTDSKEIDDELSYRNSLSVRDATFLPRVATQSAFATICRLSVHPSVCLSVTFRYRDHVGWNTSKIISRLFSLRFMLGLTPTWAI